MSPAASDDAWFFPTTVVLAVAFFVTGVFCGWRAVTAPTEEQRFRCWMYCGIASCGMWAEILLIAAMLILRQKGS